MIRYKKIYILPPQRLNQDDFDDDPETLMGLPPTEKRAEFWKRYDRRADTHDTKMTEDLSENLDVLLIFAALFSAINTAFISLTMSGLSSDPLTETNALLRLLVTRADNDTLAPADLSPPFAPSSNSVIVNCFLYASLSCSLLAAMAAMMAKEWLQSFDRTGQTGPLEEQGRFRQRKFNGVQKWRLEPIIRSLPNILLLSVILFFAGLCLFLSPINKVVAGVVIAFAGGGAILCGGSIVAGATSPLCPYQSAASGALRCTGLLFSPLWWKGLGWAIRHYAVRGPLDLVRKIRDAIHRYPSIASGIRQSPPTENLSTAPYKAATPDQAEVAQAAGWLLGTTSNRADQIAAAQFICSLDRTAYDYAFEDSENRRRLRFITHEAFDIWFSRPTESNQRVAELLGLVLCHVLHPSKGTARWEDHVFFAIRPSTSFGENFLGALYRALAIYPCHGFEGEELILHIAVLSAVISQASAIPKWPGLSRFFLSGNKSQLVDVLLTLWARIFYNADPDKEFFDQSRAFGEPVDEGNDKTVLARDASRAVICGARVLTSVQGDLQSKLQVVQGYTACLQRAVELSTELPHRELVKLINGVAGFVLSYVDPLTSSNSEESNPELLSVSTEAVVALAALLDENRRLNGIPVPRAEQHEISDLILAANHIMLDGSESLTRLGLPQAEVLKLVLKRVLERVQERVLEWDWVWVWERGRVQGQEREHEYEHKHEHEHERESAAWAREHKLWMGLRQELVRDLPLEQQWNQEQERGLVLQLAGELARRLENDAAVDAAVEAAVDAAVDTVTGAAVDGVMHQWVPDMIKDLAMHLRVESAVLRTLRWVWKTAYGTQHDHKKQKIFISSCQLWGSLEARLDFIVKDVEWSINGERLTLHDGNRDKLLTSDDLNGIVELAEDLRKDREEYEFIARNADVGINRLYIHFNRRVDWNYDLYDLREQQVLCPRSTERGIGMIW